jgi:hypothetical protein
MSPRHLGCRAVLVRSFARIHETNLKKQGILPLTFANPADYDRIRKDDRLTVDGVAGLVPGRPLTIRITHVDGTSEAVEARHSLTREQIGWFMAGSALNLIRRAKPKAGRKAKAVLNRKGKPAKARRKAKPKAKARAMAKTKPKAKSKRRAKRR